MLGVSLPRLRCGPLSCFREGISRRESDLWSAFVPWSARPPKPTRACLLRGLPPHQAGIGRMMEERGDHGGAVALGVARMNPGGQDPVRRYARAAIWGLYVSPPVSGPFRPASTMLRSLRLSMELGPASARTDDEPARTGLSWNTGFLWFRNLSLNAKAGVHNFPKRIRMYKMSLYSFRHTADSESHENDRLPPFLRSV